MTASLDEADVLFELFLPLLCETRADALQRFPHQVQLELRDTPRVWTLHGGSAPFMRRGPADGEPDVVLRVTRDLVDDLVLGRDDDLELALQTGRLAVIGNVKALAALGMTFGEAQSALSTQLQVRGAAGSSKAPKATTPGPKNNGPKSKR